MTEIPKLEATVLLNNGDKGASVRVLAFVELKIGDAFVIKNIRIKQGRLKESDIGSIPFVVFPAERGKRSDRWHDIANPCTAEARAEAVRVIMRAYDKARGEQP